MVAKDKFLIVVSVLEGRNFPRRPRHQLIAEARFDGELLATDSIEHAESPDFTQELAWELDKKGLTQHRLQRSVIKVQYYAVDKSSTMKEPIGYVMLDLRSAQNTQTSKWYPLLHSKYSRSKPEVKLGLYIDEDKGSGKSQEQSVSTGNAGILNPSLLRAVFVDEENGYWQVGPAHVCKEKFQLSVTLMSALNLAQLIPASQPLPKSSNGYFFYYSLFGSEITSDPFQDLISPNFQAERATISIRSSTEALRAFFENQSGLQIHLCCDDQSLGSCSIPLNQLLKKGSTDIYMKPGTVDGAFELAPPMRVQSLLPPISKDMAPSLTAMVVLRYDSEIGKKKQDAPSNPTAVVSKPKDGEKSHPGPSRERKRPRSPVDESPYSDDFDEGPPSQPTEENVSSINDDAQKKNEGAGAKPTNVASTVSQPLHPLREQSDSQSSNTQQHYTIPSQPHHFNFSIDLRTIANVETSTQMKTFLRYVYPFFGSAAPVMTSPPVEVSRGTEVPLPQSFCAFDFGTSKQQLENTFRTLPLVIEVWNKGDRTKDDLFGCARLPIMQVLEAERSRVPHPSGSLGWRQTLSSRVPIFPPSGGDRKIGELYVHMTLEDLGPVNTQDVQYPSESVEYTPEERPAPVEPRTPPRQPRETQEYVAALELEMWKEAQENMFENRLKEKEFQHMKALAEEWKHRDRERELLVRKKIAEYNQLEEHLRKTISDFEKKEKANANREDELSKLRKDLAREHERKVQETREASRRMKEDCDHQIELEKMKSKELQEMLNKYKSMLEEAEKKLQARDKEFSLYKDQQHSKPEVRLQSEINLLTLEKVELERKLDSVTKSKIHYKQQWGRALKELARLKQKEQENAKALLRKQHQELEHMRLRYLAAEEKEVVKSERLELEDIKTELTKLKDIENSPEKPQKIDLNSSYDEHIARLIEERDALLRTGVYSSEDRIISELDRQIRETMAQKGQ